MVNMYFNGKSFVYCKSQEEKTIKLTWEKKTKKLGKPWKYKGSDTKNQNK
jgi:hypothetical protein